MLILRGFYFYDYDFVGKDNEKWKMLGNTIPTIFTEIIGKQIINHLILMCKLPLCLIEPSDLMSLNTHGLQYSFNTFGIFLSLNDIYILS